MRLLQRLLREAGVVATDDVIGEHRVVTGVSEDDDAESAIPPSKLSTGTS